MTYYKLLLIFKKEEGFDKKNKKVLKKIISDYENSNPDRNEPVILIEAVNPELKEEIKSYFDENNIRYIETEVGCTVGIHSGERAAGIFFVTE